MKTGYYELTADVVNPKPDRRSKRRLASAEVWKSGTVVYIKDRSAERLAHIKELAGERLDDVTMEPMGEIRFTDGTQILYSLNGSSNNFPEERQGNPILKACKPAQKTLGQVLKQADWGAECLLAMLIDSGKIALEDVDAIKQKELAPEVAGGNWETHEAATNAFLKRHGI